MEQQVPHSQRKTYPLSALDQVSPRIYVRLVYVFPFAEPSLIDVATEEIGAKFRNTQKIWPFLFGEIGPDITKGPNHLKLTYNDTDRDDETRHNAAAWRDIFQTAVLPEETIPGYQQLLRLGVPPSAMRKEVLSLSPEHPQVGKSYPPVTLKANFIKGGLLLCFSMHHAVFDGGFIRAYLEAFANDAASPGIRANQDYLDACHESVRRLGESRKEGVSFPEYDLEGTGMRTGHAGVLENVGENPTGMETRISKHNPQTCRLLTLKAKVVAALRERGLEYLRNLHGSETYISTVDTICALIWVYATRARLPHLRASDTTVFTTAGDARRHMGTPAFRDHPGNFYVHTAARCTVRELLRLAGDGDGDVVSTSPHAPSKLDESLVHLAAWRIRQAVSRMAEPDYVPSRVALAASLIDPTEEGKAFRRATRPGETGINCSVWAHMGGDVQFKIPGTATVGNPGGRASQVRKTWSANEGAMNIMPRREGTKGEADWEVLVGLRAEDMDRLCAREELGGWLGGRRCEWPVVE